MDRECNKCVYSTRDGGCRKWSCEGTKTVEDIKAEAKAEIIDRCKNLLNVTHFIEGYGDMIYAQDLEIELGLIPTVEELKEKNNG